MIGETHFSASLPYLMAKRKIGGRGTRKAAMGDLEFRRAFEAAQRRLRSCGVAAVEIENPVERHLFEIFAAMALGTGKWNTFDTH